MMHIKKITVAFILISFMVVGMAATRPFEDKPKRNLKVLPKDISDDDLDKTMDGWKAALGVHCNFCHARSKDSTQHKLDYASDEKPEKNIARHMFRMTAKINKKYFDFNKDDKGNSIPAVSCITCHRGNPHPEEGLSFITV
jgi:Photosynthetic reaction centre cytochrome C subunit